MSKTGYIIIGWCISLFIVSCTNHVEQGDAYYKQASEAVNQDSVIKAYSLIEKAMDEYEKSGDVNRMNKARIFLSLLYFSTGQKDTAHEIVSRIDKKFTREEDYPLYSNCYRISAFYASIYENDTSRAVELMDSVLRYDSIYAKENQEIVNLDRLNKCEVLLNGSRTAEVKPLIDAVLESGPVSAAMLPQLYANMARWYDYEAQPDSACKYAKLVIETTSKIHEDIDNNIYALNIILRSDSLNNNLAEYVRYRDRLESLKDERQGERMKYGMAFVKEQNKSETLRMKSEAEKRTLIWISIMILLGACTVLLFLRQKHKETLIRNEMIQLECDRLDAEAFRRKLENELLRHKINSKSDELVKANNEILELSQQLAKKKDDKGNENDTYLQRLLDAATSSFPDFPHNISERYPAITKTETTLACLIKLNLSSEEITTAMSISKSGLIKARYRLRKRLGIETSAELDNFIARL